VNSFVFNFDTKAKTLNRLMTYEYWGYPKDFIFQYRKRLEAVTRQDVLRVAQKYLQPNQMVMVVVGKPSDFDQPLASLGLPVTPLDITIPQPKQERAKADAGSLAAGRAALLRAQKAAGGAQKLASIKDAVYTANARLSGPMGNMTVKQKVQILFPSAMRQENELPFGRIDVYTDGQTGWMKSPQGQMPLPDAQLQQARGQLFQRLETLLLSDRDPNRTVNFVRKDKVGDSDVDVIEISAKDGGGEQALLFIDGSGQVLKKEYRGQAMAGAPATVQEVYEDFRKVNGVRIPFKTTTFQNEKKFSETELAEVRYNTGLKAEDLAKP
jgi:outer membrane lipoprotein-sorting protein